MARSFELFGKIAPIPPDISVAKIPWKVINDFADFYYKNTPDVKWLGHLICKSPFDLWVYQEIIYRVQPDFIIETGTGLAGSALYFASLCDLIKKGRVISIDIEEITGRPSHERVEYLIGSSVSDDIIQRVSNIIGDKRRIVCNFDSIHTSHHVLKELRLYSPFLKLGSYIIVEDTNLDKASPIEAVEQFIKENDKFAIDRSWEKFFFTFNPKGFLKKVKDD